MFLQYNLLLRKARADKGDAQQLNKNSNPQTSWRQACEQQCMCDHPPAQLSCCYEGHRKELPLVHPSNHTSVTVAMYWPWPAPQPSPRITACLSDHSAAIEPHSNTDGGTCPRLQGGQGQGWGLQNLTALNPSEAHLWHSAIVLQCPNIESLLPAIRTVSVVSRAC
eukprot:967238-Amphidinium_carterae.2